MSRGQNMDTMDIIRSRHSVRQYPDRPIPQEIRSQLNASAEALKSLDIGIKTEANGA